MIAAIGKRPWLCNAASMRKIYRTLLAAVATGALPAISIAAQPTDIAADPDPSPNQIVASATPEEWKQIEASDILVMMLAPDQQGRERRIVIQLMPGPLTTRHRDNIKTLARAHFWDGTSINRVQDNYVVQWGDAGVDNPESEDPVTKPLPDGLINVPESEYMTHEDELKLSREELEKTRPMARILQRDSFAPYTDFEDGWPLASDLQGHFWPVHCYAMVGVGRNYSPDTGTGAELYTVIGQAPRHLDRNIALVGRVIAGMEHLTSLPRGTGDLGFYETPQERTDIVSIRLASELPHSERPDFSYLDSASATFVRYAEARANRRDPFFITPAGGTDICNVPVPIRENKTGQ